MAKHIYIIDTCVLLHDPLALYKFGDNDIYIPLAVIDDLDDIKTRKENVGWSARQVFRNLEHYSLQDLLKGVKINEVGGRLFVYNTESPLQKNERPNIIKVHSDNAIIECCLALKAANPRKKVAIITKDTGLRIRAITWGCAAENYRADQLSDEIYTGIRKFELNSDTDWNLLWSDNEIEKSKLSPETLEKLGDIYPNEFILFNYGDKICPTLYKRGIFRILKEKSNAKETKGYSGVQGKNLEQKCALEILSDLSVALVTLSGPAGTGKSFLALAAALQMINEGIYDKIVVMKPLIPVGGKDIGALPGDKFDKISAWLGPIKDNIDQILGSKSLSANNMFEEMVRDGIIEVEAMAFIQGRSIPRSIIILDECLVAGSMIYMADGSVKKIEDIVDGDEVISFDVENQTWTTNKISNKFSRPTEELIEIHTSKGYLKCTPTHQMWVYENGSELVKKQAQHINLSDLIPVSNNFTHQVLNDLSPEEAGLLALTLTDGHIEKNLYTMKYDFSKDQEWLADTFKSFTSNFNKTVISNSNSRNNMICRIYGKQQISDFINKHKMLSGNKAARIEVPNMIWNAPLESVKKFIQICFDCEGDVNIESRNCVSKAVVSFGSTSKNFIYQLQALLTKFEIDSHIYISKKSDKTHNTQYKLSIVGGFMCNKFAQNIGFSMARKQEKLLSVSDETFFCPYIYPKISLTSVYNNLEDDGRWKDKNTFSKARMNEELGLRVTHNTGPSITQKTLDRFMPIADRENIDLKNIVVCSKINQITKLQEKAEVYDFTVENTHTFVVNGMLSSNCENISPREARMVVERCGKDSKVILLGDLSQVENPYLDAKSNGLSHAISGGKNSELVASVTLSKVERSELAAVASEIFNRPEARRN